MTNPFKHTPEEEKRDLLKSGWPHAEGALPKDIMPGTVIKVFNASGVTTYHATGYAKVGDTSVSAKIRNAAMPSGYELADVSLFSTDTVIAL